MAHTIELDSASPQRVPPSNSNAPSTSVSQFGNSLVDALRKCHPWLNSVAQEELPLSWATEVTSFNPYACGGARRADICGMTCHTCNDSSNAILLIAGCPATETGHSGPEQTHLSTLVSGVSGVLFTCNRNAILCEHQTLAFLCCL